MANRVHSESNSVSSQESIKRNSSEEAAAGLPSLAALSDSQKEILDMLEGRPAAMAPAIEPSNAAKRGFGLDVAFAVTGALSIMSGVVLLFFFAALGAVVLVLGAILCAVAFEHVALADLAAEEAELKQTVPLLTVTDDTLQS